MELVDGKKVLSRVLIVFSCLLAVAGALSISLPTGTMEALKPMNVTWKHSPNDNTPFYLRKIKLDEPGGPGSPSSDVTIPNSPDDEGACSLEFDKPGLFEVVAFDAQNNKPMFTTEITVLSPTSTSAEIAAPTYTSSSVPAPISTLSSESTKSSDTSNAPKSLNVAIVAGGVAGGITRTVLLSITLILCCRRKRCKKILLRIPYPFYNESGGSASWVPVSGEILPTTSSAGVPRQNRVRATTPSVALPSEEKRLTASRSRDGVDNVSNEDAVAIDDNVTEVSEQPPSYRSEVPIQVASVDQALAGVLGIEEYEKASGEKERKKKLESSVPKYTRHIDSAISRLATQSPHRESEGLTLKVTGWIIAKEAAQLCTVIQLRVGHLRTRFWFGFIPSLHIPPYSQLDEPGETVLHSWVDCCAELSKANPKSSFDLNAEFVTVL
ncbi:hypothetical protein BDP27DRAFT_1369761 [Rhodocollybia butyracea]|uniref:Uncharacterized protein n=1 Tax=Rhodocollybia butyracea TaxID=206335 RepID=A0A9P5PDI3_9AGAR|nr:hypothetical protein BDP27DRAFT_1369761 [Rhodocollybia butyracea]